MTVSYTHLPNCNIELPDEAHYCPRCMFQYEKQEIQIKDTHKKYILLWVVGSVLIIGMLIVIPLVKLGIQSRVTVSYTHLDVYKRQHLMIILRSSS